MSWKKVGGYLLDVLIILVVVTISYRVAVIRKIVYGV